MDGGQGEMDCQLSQVREDSGVVRVSESTPPSQSRPAPLADDLELGWGPFRVYAFWADFDSHHYT